MKKTIKYALLFSLLAISQCFCSQLPHNKKRAATDDLNLSPAKKFKIPNNQDLEFKSLAENAFENILPTHSIQCVNNDISDLVEAIKNDQFDDAKRLILNGMNLTQKDSEFSILALAIQYNNDNSHNEIIDLLIDNGATTVYNTSIERSALPLAPFEAAISNHYNMLAKRLMRQYAVPLSERTLFAAFQSGNHEMALIILNELKQLGQPLNATYKPDQLGRAFGNFIPSWVLEKKRLDAYKIKQMIRAKEVELLEIE